MDRATENLRAAAAAAAVAEAAAAAARTSRASRRDILGGTHRTARSAAAATRDTMHDANANHAEGHHADHPSVIGGVDLGDLSAAAARVQAAAAVAGSATARSHAPASARVKNVAGSSSVHVPIAGAPGSTSTHASHRAIHTTHSGGPDPAAAAPLSLGPESQCPTLPALVENEGVSSHHVMQGPGGPSPRASLVREGEVPEHVA